MERKLRVCSLFSGCGGLDLGFILAGFKVVFAIDSYSRACESYDLSLGLPIIQKKIQDVSHEDIPDCDVVIGGFPCPGFSTAGWFKKEDVRNELYLDMLKVIRAKQPKFYLAENVMGLLYMEHGKVLNYILNDFRKLGYNVKYKDINCAYKTIPIIPAYFNNWSDLFSRGCFLEEKINIEYINMRAIPSTKFATNDRLNLYTKDIVIIFTFKICICSVLVF